MRDEIVEIIVTPCAQEGAARVGEVDVQCERWRHAAIVTKDVATVVGAAVSTRLSPAAFPQTNELAVRLAAFNGCPRDQPFGC